MPPVPQSSLPTAVVGAEGAAEEGDSLAWLGLSRPPTDGLSLVPRNICFSSNFIRLMLVQLGNCPALLPHSPVKVKVKGQVQLPIPHLPSKNFGVGRGGGLVDWPFLNATPGTLPGPVHCASVSPSALRHSSQKAEKGGQERYQKLEGNNPVL